jgi:hypothetical protein
MQAGKARLHLQSAMTAESYSSKINELHVSVQSAFVVQFHKKAIKFHYQIKDLYVQNPFVHKVDERI